MNERIGNLWSSARFRRIAVVAALSLIVAATLAMLGAGLLARTTPAWWRTVHADDPKTIQTAEYVENEFINQMYHERPVGGVGGARGVEEVGGVVGGEARADGTWRSEEWIVALDTASANAWLNTRLPKWLANQGVEWPEQVHELQVDFRDGAMVVGMSVRLREGDRYLSATLAPSVTDGGPLWMPARWIHIGQLSLPARWALGQAESRAASYLPGDLPETERMFSIFGGDSPMLHEPTIPLGDGRRIRLLRVRTKAGRIEVTCRTEGEA